MSSNAPFSIQIQAKPPLYGILVTLSNPSVAEMLSLCGYDWLFIDMEHSPLDCAATQSIIQAIRGQCLSLVRIPENNPVWIKKVLDLGCDGIIVPQIRTADDVRAAVAAAKFPPEGTRSVGIARAHGYGLHFAEYLKTANQNVSVIIQVEHIDAVNHLEEILAVPGFDGVFVGPYDLSGSMNHLGEVNHSEVQGAIRTTKEQCRRQGVPYGIFVGNTTAAKQELADGCGFIAVGIDATVLTNAAKASLSELRGEGIHAK